MRIIWLVVFLIKSELNSTINDDLIYITVSLYVLFIGLPGLSQGDIFTNLPDKFLSEGLINNKKQRYIKSGLKEDQANEIKQQLKKMIPERKFFLDKNISCLALQKC